MKKFDHIVVGSGAGGLTLASLLAKNGRSVLLIEKSPMIGGCLQRFTKKGIPFDTGFHFTGGFGKDGMLSDMLKVLGMDERIVPEFIDREKDNHVIFENDGTDLTFPTGYAAVAAKMKLHFPSEAKAIDDYFARVERICKETRSMDLAAILAHSDPIEEDFVTLQDYLDSVTREPRLQAALSVYSMCYGVSPKEISFANHARVCYSMYQSVARVKHGGQAFIDEFKRHLAASGVTVMTNTFIVSCDDVKERRVGTFVLNNGERIVADSCIFTIHPQLVREVLPQEVLTQAFKERVDEFEPSVGFFSLYAVCDGADEALFTPGVISIFPDSDINAAFTKHGEIDRPLVVIKSREEIKGVTRNVINAFELELPSDVAAWRESTRKDRPVEYRAYKERKQARLEERIYATMPFLKGHFEVLDASTMLTFKDYLHDPHGGAYGVKQKMGQLNLFGRVGLKNIFVAGQSAVLPGVMGTMMASFLICKLLLDKETYESFIREKLGR